MTHKYSVILCTLAASGGDVWKNPRAVLETIVAAGLTIRPGNLLHGDESGLVSVPIEIAEDIGKRAQEVGQEEADFFDFLESNEFTVEELKRRITPHE